MKQKNISSTYIEPSAVTPPPPVADYNVTGTLVPDATCNYFFYDMYGGFPTYRREDGAYFIWFDDELMGWVITNIYISKADACWGMLDEEEITGDKPPISHATGIAHIAEGPH